MLFFIFSDTVFACDLTAYSLADHADNRRQKTVGTNESAKADAAENAEKDSCGTEGVYVVCSLSAIICVICGRH